MTVPSWFKYRQGKAEEAGADIFKLTGPNLREGYVAIREIEPGRWQCALRFAPEGPDAAASDATFPTRQDAWEAAFELFRNHVVV